MHAIPFQLKRAHLKTNAYNKRLIAHVPGMTPARFDVMCLLRQFPISLGKEAARRMPGSEFQLWLVRQLGLHPSTISKMLAVLERLGWIERVRFLLDRRYKVVNVTALGMKRIWEAMRYLWRQRPLLRTYEKIARGFFPERHVLEGLDLIWNIIDGIARAFFDSNGIWYDYGSRTQELAPKPGTAEGREEGSEASDDAGGHQAIATKEAGV